MMQMAQEMPKILESCFNLSINVVGGERGASRTEVTGPNFITQGVSPTPGCGLDSYLWPNADPVK
jgi:hypothetical protein